MTISEKYPGLYPGRSPKQGIAIKDAIAIASHTSKGIQSFESSCDSAAGFGESGLGGLERTFLTYYADLLFTTGFTVSSSTGSQSEQLILDAIDLMPILKALREARILYMQEGYSNVIIAPTYTGSSLPENPQEGDIKRYWARLERLPLQGSIGVEVAGISSNPTLIRRKGYPLNRIANDGEMAAKGILEEYAVEFNSVPIAIGVKSEKFLSPLASFTAVLSQYDNQQLPMIVDLARAMSFILVQEPGLNELARRSQEAGTDDYKTLIEEKMRSYQKMRANGVIFADTDTDINVVSRDLDGLVEVAEVFRNRLSAESDGIPQDRMWNYQAQSGGMNTTDRNTEQERSRLKQLAPAWIDAIERWVRWSLIGEGLGEVAFKVEMTLEREVEKVENQQA